MFDMVVCLLVICLCCPISIGQPCPISVGQPCPISIGQPVPFWSDRELFHRGKPACSRIHLKSKKVKDPGIGGSGLKDKFLPSADFQPIFKFTSRFCSGFLPSKSCRLSRRIPRTMPKSLRPTFSNFPDCLPLN